MTKGESYTKWPSRRLILVSGLKKVTLQLWPHYNLKFNIWCIEILKLSQSVHTAQHFLWQAIFYEQIKLFTLLTPLQLFLGIQKMLKFESFPKRRALSFRELFYVDDACWDPKSREEKKKSLILCLTF